MMLCAVATGSPCTTTLPRTTTSAKNPPTITIKYSSPAILALKRGDVSSVQPFKTASRDAMRSVLPVSIHRLRQVIEKSRQREIAHRCDNVRRESHSSMKKENEGPHKYREHVIQSDKSAPITGCGFHGDVRHMPTSFQNYSGLRSRLIRTASARQSAVKINPVQSPELSRKCPGVMCVIGLIGQSFAGATADSLPPSRYPNIWKKCDVLKNKLSSAPITSTGIAAHKNAARLAQLETNSIQP